MNDNKDKLVRSTTDKSRTDGLEKIPDRDASHDNLFSHKIDEMG